MRRQEDESRAIPMRKVSIEGIGALVPGVSTIEDAWVSISGVRVTQVPVGDKFDIYCHYKAINKAGGYWKATVTVIGIGIANYEDTRVFGGDKEDYNCKLDNMGDNIMPNHDISLRFKLWLHDDTSEKHPPTDTW